MKKVVAFVFLSIVYLQNVVAQDGDANSRENNIDLSYGFAENADMMRLAYTHYWGLGAKQKFHIGGGARLLTVFGDRWRMAEVNTSNNADGGIDENAIVTNDITLGAINLGLYLKYDITPRWEVGLNFDIVGLGMVNEEGTEFFSSGNELGSSVQQTKSPGPNIAFTRGQVSSDNLWLGYNFANKFQARVGYNFTGNELEVEDLPQELEDPRFERINSMVIVGFGYYF